MHRVFDPGVAIATGRRHNRRNGAARRMMPLGLLGLGCAVLSAAGVVFLAALDPKRRRDARRASWSSARRLMAFAVFAPGIVLGFFGLWSEFLVWIGAAAVLGRDIQRAMAPARWRHG